MIPKDPVMLLSFINTQLRDNYNDLDDLAEGLELDSNGLEDLIHKLEGIGYSYDKKNNNFS